MTLLIVTPPLMLAWRRLANPGPGSKKPEPLTDVPLIVTLIELWPAEITEGDAEAGVAGGGASNLKTRN